MEELFRFSVIRAATRSSAVTVSLQRPATPAIQASPPVDTTAPNIRAVLRPTASRLASLAAARGGLVQTIASPPKSFQDQLSDIVRSLDSDNPRPEIVWKRLEPVALDFALSRGHSILTNDLWMALPAFLESFQTALEGLTAGAQLTSPTVMRSFEAQRAQPGISGYRFDLADLFIALLILRRGGTANLEAIIRPGHLWDAVEFLTANPTLQDLADRIRIIELIEAGPGTLIPPADVKTAADVRAAMRTLLEGVMKTTMLLPPGIFARLRKPVHGVGFRELHIVRQHIRRYETVEVARIENILKGESRGHATKHTLSNERTTFVQTDTTTETDKELTSTDHVDIKNETGNQVKEATKVDAGVHAQYDGGSFKLQADLTVSYDKASEETKKFSSDVAKDVTQKAATKVTQRVTQSQTTKIIETFEDTEDQSFDNKTGPGHVSGVYQWVEKVYLAQVFNLGRHMVLDMMVPEPGAPLLAAAGILPADQTPPAPPEPLATVRTDSTGRPLIGADGNKQLDPLRPDQLLERSPVSSDPSGARHYGEWIAKFQVTGVDPPPAETVTAAKAFSDQAADNNVHLKDVITLPDGYAAYTSNISVAWRTTGSHEDDSRVDVLVGQQARSWGKGLNGPNLNPGGGSRNYTGFVQEMALRPDGLGKAQLAEQGSIAVALDSVFSEEVSATIEIVCKRAPELTAKWQLQTFEKIAARWQQLQTAYEDKLNLFKMQRASLGPLGAADAEANRLAERIELKRACVAILDNANETVRGLTPNIAVQPSPDLAPQDPQSLFKPSLPEPVLPFQPNPQGNMTTETLGATVRWFEQAFEWENIAYVLYPYFWGRRETWIQRLNLRHDDALFLNFLRAGYARVLVPVRLGFEWAVHFYLHSGLPWLGGGLPPIGDRTQNPLYLDIAEEIKALTGGGESGETETPLGQPWEYRLPTTLIKLRKDDTLPAWSRVDPDGKTDPKRFPSDQPSGPWTWADSTPKSPK